MTKLRIIPGLVAAVVVLTFGPAGSLGSHRSRASGRARTERGAHSNEGRKRETGARGKRGERLSRAERRRNRRGGYASSRRGRRYEARHGRHRRVYYESRESSAASGRPASSTGIPADRVAEIQRALIKEGYLEGQASGQYDDSTIAAMKQFQAENGFPASGLPSAHALRKLGVAKRSNDGYAVPINSATEDQKKPSQPPPQVKKGKASASTPEPNK